MNTMLEAMYWLAAMAGYAYLIRDLVGGGTWHES